MKTKFEIKYFQVVSLKQFFFYVLHQVLQIDDGLRTNF